MENKLENRSVMIVFREGAGKWWNAWDGSRHDPDTFNFKNSLWHCIDTLGKFNQIGVIFLNEEAHGVQDNPASFRPTSDLDIEVISDGVGRFNVVKWADIPECLHSKVFNATKASKQLSSVEFDMNVPDQFLSWVDVKMFGVR